MEDITSAQDATLNNVAEAPAKKDSNGFWKGLLRTVLSITISIILTFGTSALIQWRHLAKDRKMTAMMVMGNIETFAQHLEKSAVQMGWNDTLATFLLAIPMDSLDVMNHDTLLYYINQVTSYYSLNRDKSAENIFSNSIDTWKNLGNFEFIENVGNCYDAINNMENIYNEFLTTTDRVRERMMKNLDACPGNTMGSKVLHDGEYRSHLAHIHGQAEYYQYLAAYIRWRNTKNMKLMGVTEEEVKQFVEEQSRKVEMDVKAPDQNAYRTPPVDPNGLPDIKSWVWK